MVDVTDASNIKKKTKKKTYIVVILLEEGGLSGWLVPGELTADLTYTVESWSNSVLLLASQVAGSLRYIFHHETIYPSVPPVLIQL